MFFFSDKAVRNIEQKIDFLIGEDEKNKAEIALLKQQIACNQEQMIQMNRSVIQYLDYLKQQNANLINQYESVIDRIANNEAARKESAVANAAEVAKLGELLSENKSIHNAQDLIAKLNQLNQSVQDCSSISKKNNDDLSRVLNEISLVDDATRLIMLSSVIDKIDLNNDEKK